MGTGASSGKRNSQLSSASQTQRTDLDEQPVEERADSRPLGMHEDYCPLQSREPILSHEKREIGCSLLNCCTVSKPEGEIK